MLQIFVGIKCGNADWQSWLRITQKQPSELPKISAIRKTGKKPQVDSKKPKEWIQCVADLPKI